MKRSRDALLDEWGYVLSIPTMEAEQELYRMLAAATPEKEVSMISNEKQVIQRVAGRFIRTGETRDEQVVVTHLPWRKGRPITKLPISNVLTAMDAPSCWMSTGLMPTSSGLVLVPIPRRFFSVM